MNDDYSYLRVLATTTQEVMVKEEHDHPVESSETLSLTGPEAPAVPKLSHLTMVGPSLLSIVQNITSWL